MRNKWLIVLILAFFPWIQATQASDIARALKKIETMLPDDVERPLALYQALLSYAEQPTESGKKEVM